MPANKNRNRRPPAVAEPAYVVKQVGGTELADRLMDPERSKAAVVVSYLQSDKLRLDAHRLAERLGAEADVYELCNGTETRRLEAGLPEKLHVFGNGVRIYPPGPDWQARTSKPHLLKHPSQLPAMYDTVEDAVLSAQRTVPQTITAPLPTVREAFVKGFVNEELALVELLPHGTQGLIRGEELLPGIPLEWVLAKGQKVSGSFDPETRYLDIHAMLLPSPSPITHYRNGDVALARVTAVCPDQAFVQFWPGSTFPIPSTSITSNELDSVQDLLTEDEVVPVRVLYENGAVRLSMLDVDDDEEIVPAPPLVRGGPPWLDLIRAYSSLTGPAHTGTPNDAADDGGAQPAGVAHEPQLTPAERRTALQSTQRELEAARHQNDRLVAEAKRKGATDQIARKLQDQLATEREAANHVEGLLNAAERQIDTLKEELGRTKSKLVELRKQRRSEGSRSEKPAEALFLDPGEQFRFELLMTWAEIVPPAEKAGHPLSEFTLGDSFLDSWAALTQPQRRKSLRTLVYLVAGLGDSLRKREPHPLRLGDGAHSGTTMRGGDACWRLYVEQGTPGALRLHYWKLATGGVELHEVVSHDVVKP